MADPRTQWRHALHGRYPRRSRLHLLALSLLTLTTRARIRRLQRCSGHGASVHLTSWERSTTAEQIIGATGRCTQGWGRTPRAALRALQRAVTHKDQNDIADHGPVSLPKRESGIAGAIGIACVLALVAAAWLVLP